MTPVREPSGPARRHTTSSAGLGLAIYDFGGRGPDLLLVHATGFCAEPFGPLVRHLSGRFRCWGLDLRGHGRSERPADGDFAWGGFADDVLAVVDELGLDRPYGFGHSCGGATVLLAEQARPGLFRALYCFEPVVMPDTVRARFTERNPLADAARRRRERFPSADDALANYAAKPPYADLDPEVLRLYVESGFEPVPSGAGGDGRAVRLRCSPADEAATFTAAADHDAFHGLRTVACPVVLSCGEETDAFGPRLMRADADAMACARVEVLAGMGHFGPLQRPPRVAASVIRAFTGAGTPMDDTAPS